MQDITHPLEQTDLEVQKRTTVAQHAFIFKLLDGFF